MRAFVLVCALTTLAANNAHADEKPNETPTRKVDFGPLEQKLDCGTVLAITKDSILIVDRRKPPVSYPFHDRLAAGTVHKKVTESMSYLVADIQAGDLVSLGVITENKQKFCVEIGIHERPGGILPPGQVVDKERPWYQWQNAQFAFRDKGTPIPEHLKPEGVKLLEQQEKDRLKK